MYILRRLCTSSLQKSVRSLTPVSLYFWWYWRTPEIETADLSQSHAGLNLSQFQDDYLVAATMNILIFTWYCINNNKSKTSVFDVI